MQFQCAEAAFQAAKFAHDRKLMASFTRLTGEQAFKRGKELSASWTSADHDQWRNRNVPIMEKIVQAKFSQNKNLKRLLLKTGGAYLVEHSNRDSFWADNGDGTGLNMLGKINMRTRGNLGGSGIRSCPANY